MTATEYDSNQIESYSNSLKLLEVEKAKLLRDLVNATQGEKRAILARISSIRSSIGQIDSIINQLGVMIGEGASLNIRVEE